MYVAIKKTNNEFISKSGTDLSVQYGSADYYVLWVKSTEIEGFNLPTRYMYMAPDGIMTETYTSGSIVPQTQIDFAVARQKQFKDMVTSGLVNVTALNGKTYSTLTTNDVKLLTLFALAMNGMIDGSGAVSVTGVTADELYQKILR